MQPSPPPIHYSPNTSRNKGRSLAYIIIAVFIGFSVIGTSVWFLAFANNKELSDKELYYQSLANTGSAIENGVTFLSTATNETPLNTTTKQSGSLVINKLRTGDDYFSSDFYLNILSKMDIQFEGRSIDGNSQYLFTLDLGEDTVVADVILTSLSENPKLYVKFDIQGPNSSLSHLIERGIRDYSNVFQMRLNLTLAEWQTFYNHLDKWWEVDLDSHDTPINSGSYASILRRMNNILNENLIAETKSTLSALQQHVFTNNTANAILQISDNPKPVEKEGLLRYEAKINTNNMLELREACLTSSLRTSSMQSAGCFFGLLTSGSNSLVGIEQLEQQNDFFQNNYTLEVWVDADKKVVTKIRQILKETNNFLDFDFNVQNTDQEIGIGYNFQSEGLNLSMNMEYMVAKNTVGLELVYNVNPASMILTRSTPRECTADGECPDDDAADTSNLLTFDFKLDLNIVFIEKSDSSSINIPQNAKPFSELTQ